MIDLLGDQPVVDVLTGLLLLAGAAFTFIAGLGVLRLPDIMIRMHASTKAGTLGTGLILLAVAVSYGTLSEASRAIAAIIFLLITAPVAAHMIGRAAYRSGVPLWDRTVVDEFRDRRPLPAPTGDDSGVSLPAGSEHPAEVRTPAPKPPS
ncbi:MAG: monovalent cation/H(+) antiporter subunit G [Rhodospirillales bacterium]|nr:MAG: monovalent cation/H(+) antiporter subunit G [Rhodospirillales bacterium]